MVARLLTRLLRLLALLVLASMVVFVVLEVLPGDPAAVILGTGARPDTLAALRTQMGLDQPLWWRYGLWLGSFVTGDLGVSYTYATPVAQMVADRLGVSLPLTLLALTLSTVIALPLGVFAAAAHRRPGDWLTMGVSQIGVSIPNFWFGILLMLLFAVTLKWVPAGGFPGWEAGVWPGLRALILPSIALALPQAAILTRVTRSAVLDTLNEDFVRTARAKGRSRRGALWLHALRPALIPVITILGLQFSFLLAGTVIIENVFSLPGLGRLLFQAIAQRDLVTVKSLLLLLVAAVITVNFFVDVLYGIIDPRLRTGGVHG
jgi:peptide/nickel transport system permease protein